MLTGISTLRRASRCHDLHRTCLQYTRSASRLSAVKRGLQGESQNEPRRFSGRPSRGRDDVKSDNKSHGRSYDRAPPRRNNDSVQGKDPFGRPLSSGDRKSYGGSSPRKNHDFAQEKDPFGRPSSGRDEGFADRRPFGRGSSRSNDDSADKEQFGRGSPRSNDDRKPYGRDSPRDNDGRKPYDRGHSRRSDDMSREKKSFDRDASRRNDQPSRERKPYDGKFQSRDNGRTPNSSFSKPEDSSSRHEYISIPYTTAASEFLYGLNVVYAALKSRRRSLYTLYIHKRARENVYKGADLEKLAVSAGVKIRRVDNDFLPVMDKMTDNRPHNGVILETSPLMIPSVEQLGKVQLSNRKTPLLLSQTQTPEQRAIYGSSHLLSPPTDPWRQPLVLLLDGILDPGNLGNILRTAYFYGVDAVAICINTCAPLTSSALHKAASGATEALNILAIHRPADFVSISSRNGWRTHAAIAPGDGGGAGGSSGSGGGHTTKPQFSTNRMVSPLTRAPSILMMGAEGEGLRANLKNKASYNVLIQGQQRSSGSGGDAAAAAVDLGVDSLNVGAATAVLIEAFMRPPVEMRDRRGKGDVKSAQVEDKDGEREDGKVEVGGDGKVQESEDNEKMF